MNVKHHIDDATLTAFATGNLPEAFNVVVASHVSLNDEARVRLEALEAVGGILIEGIDVIEMSYGSLGATLRMIQNETSEITEAPTAITNRCAIMPQPLAEYVGGSLKDVKWRSLGMGTKQAILKTSKNATARLLYIPAGVEMPDHGHKGIEMTLVLQGAFIDGSQRFARGDIEIVDEHMEHTPVADIGEDCICLVASNAPLKFRGLMPRLAQVFLRI
jgi:putative transcriptional regulator